MSENICVLLNKVMEEVGAVSKRERNQQQNFSFRGIDAVVNAVSPALRAHGVIVFPELLGSDYSNVEVGKNRTLMGHCRVTVKYTYMAPDGSSISSVVAAESMDSGDKATAKAMSVAFRTSLLQTLCLPTDDKDPDHEVYERSPNTGNRGTAPQTTAEPSFEERLAKFNDACQKEGIDPQTILSMAGIKEPTEDDLPQLRETFKAYKTHLATQQAEPASDPDGMKQVAQAVQNLNKAFNMPKSDLEEPGRGSNSNRPASQAQIGKLQATYRSKGYDNITRLEHASSVLGIAIESFTNLTVKQASKLIDTLTA